MGRFLDCVAALNTEELRRLDKAQERIESTLLLNGCVLNRPENWVVVALEVMAECIKERIDRCQAN